MTTKEPGNDKRTNGEEIHCMSSGEFPMSSTHGCAIAMRVSMLTDQLEKMRENTAGTWKFEVF